MTQHSWAELSWREHREAEVWIAEMGGLPSSYAILIHGARAAGRDLGALSPLPSQEHQLPTPPCPLSDLLAGLPLRLMFSQ